MSIIYEYIIFKSMKAEKKTYQFGLYTFPIIKDAVYKEE
jgi:hypothetical protein